MNKWKGLTNSLKATSQPENPCKTPGMKIRSQGKGRELARRKK